MHNHIERNITRLFITWTEGLHQESSVNEGPHFWSVMVIPIAILQERTWSGNLRVCQVRLSFDKFKRNLTYV